MIKVINGGHGDSCAEKRTRVRCRYVRFNGARFGTACTSIDIPEFHGEKLVNELPVFPLRFHADRNLEKKLADRGSRVLEYQGTSYRDYNGSAKNSLLE